jgi:DNA polymerase-3 subunit alpha
MDDKKTFELFRDVRMIGVPQLQSSWVVPIIQDVQPKVIGDVVDLVTMIRPGSMDSGQTDRYRAFCRGEKTKPDVPELKPIVEPYKNCLLYQEQIMKLATDLGSFSLDKADELRKVCAKTKYIHLAQPLLDDLISNMKKDNVPQKNIDKIIEIVKAFFAYSFNKAHAAGYGVTSYRCAWLKSNYFLEFARQKRCKPLNS